MNRFLWAVLFCWLPNRGDSQTPPFSAQYRARFHRSAGFGCTVIRTPEIRVACRGQISLTRTSHPTIVCPSTSAEDLDGYNYLQCRTTCQTEEECSDVFLGNSTGFIEFECAGEDATNIEAYTSFEDDGNSVCLQLPVQGQFERPNFRFATLGVLCDGRYVISDFFECGPGAFSADLEGLSGCASGEFCSPDGCTVDFDRVVARSKVDRFADSCIMTNTGNGNTASPTQVPTLAPIPTNLPTPAPTVDRIVSPTTTIPSQVTSGSSSNSMVGPIVGGVIGAIAIISASVVAGVFLTHRRQRSVNGSPVVAKDTLPQDHPQVPAVIEAGPEIPDKGDHCLSVLYEPEETVPYRPDPGQGVQEDSPSGLKRDSEQGNQEYSVSGLDPTPQTQSDGDECLSVLYGSGAGQP